MDFINEIRSAVTVGSFVLFLALVRWAWSARRRGDFSQAAQLPLDGEEGAQ